MVKEGMYVRCPADIESSKDPRVFICAQVIGVDEFAKTVKVKVQDPFNVLQFYDALPMGVIEYRDNELSHCHFFGNSEVVYQGEKHKVITFSQGKDGYFYYFLQNDISKEIVRVCETGISASFNNGQVSPISQLARYELQNPCWYLARTVVLKNINILNNSIFGFNILAGCKIYLLPHQVTTIMRCLQEDPCRFMLADEVGMGKTIEAASVLKIYMHDHCDCSILIVVPKMLKAQWKTELAFKFGINVGVNNGNNWLDLKSIDEIDVTENYDFLVVDEVHRYLKNINNFRILWRLSNRIKNILLLSATPVQQRGKEYLKLLTLLSPKKYSAYNEDSINDLIDKQKNIIQRSFLALDDLADFEEEIENSTDIDPHENEDCIDLFDEIMDELEQICEELQDDKLNEYLEQINFKESDCGEYHIKVILSYICGNYQIESHIIRNRRKLLEASEDTTRLVPKRELITYNYELNTDKNIYENETYDYLGEWIEKISSAENVDTVLIKGLLGSFFSSSWEFCDYLEQIRIIEDIPDEILESARLWRNFEDKIIDNVNDIILDPETYSDYYSTRMMKVVKIINDFPDNKMVIFTNYNETFQAYSTLLYKMFREDQYALFQKDMDPNTIELETLKFQTEDSCRILLCDASGGEGRNFQCADYVVHIDLPWDANMIEQRIGRLDRLERDVDRPVVYSVVVVCEDTFEKSLFHFWSEGLRVFNESLSGMEIIIDDINNEILDAVSCDFSYELDNRIDSIKNKIDEIRVEIRQEQSFDIASAMFNPVNTKIRNLIEYYSANENQLFANSMVDWATLAGFRGMRDQGGDIITYSPNSFSFKSAANSQLIPPNWSDYINIAQNKFITNIQNLYESTKRRDRNDRSIKGTFLRKLAIENDYLHFFAPGDDIFDCIIDNAVNSCKGQSCAFGVLSDIDWRGLIIIMTARPNYNYLIEQGVSLYELSPYRNFLMSDEVIIPISIENEEDHSDQEIIRAYTQIINKGYRQHRTVHLGKRGRTPLYLKDIIGNQSNIHWFRQEYSSENWRKYILREAEEEAYKKATVELKKRSNIREAREEMERLLSSRVANSEYYGISDDGIARMEQSQKVILEAIKRPHLVMESAAFIWMVKSDEY